MPTIEDILLRITAHAPLTTKGSKLTFPEVDNNWIVIYDFLKSLNTTSNLAPFDLDGPNGDQTLQYSNTIPNYVSYLGNSYVAITAAVPYNIPPTGHVDSATHWALVTTGALAHAQNTDNFLAIGTANQVSANQMWLLFNDSLIQTSRVALIALRDANGLKIGRWYHIIDKNIIVLSTANNQLSELSYFIANYTAAGQIDAGTPARRRIERILYLLDADIIVYREDNLGNKISHQNTIAAFPWGYGGAYFNTILGETSFTIDDLTDFDFGYNVLHGGNNVHLEASSGLAGSVLFGGADVKVKTGASLNACKISEVGTQVYFQQSHVGRTLNRRFSDFKETFLSTAIISGGNTYTIPADSAVYCGEIAIDLTGAVANANITDVINLGTNFPYKFTTESATGFQLIFTSAAIAGVGANKVVSNQAAPASLRVPEYGGFIIFERLVGKNANRTVLHQYYL